MTSELKEQIQTIEEALKSAQEMHKWFSARLVAAEREMERYEEITREPTPQYTQELFDSMRDGLMASYRDEFAISLSVLQQLKEQTTRHISDDMVEKAAEAMQLCDADIFPTLNLQKKDYARKLAKAALTAALKGE